MPPSQAEEAFNELDEAEVRAEFAAADSDGSGQLSHEELQKLAAGGL